MRGEPYGRNVCMYEPESRRARNDRSVRCADEMGNKVYQNANPGPGSLAGSMGPGPFKDHGSCCGNRLRALDFRVGLDWK